MNHLTQKGEIILSRNQKNKTKQAWLNAKLDWALKQQQQQFGFLPLNSSFILKSFPIWSPSWQPVTAGLYIYLIFPPNNKKNLSLFSSRESPVFSVICLARVTHLSLNQLLREREWDVLSGQAQVMCRPMAWEPGISPTYNTGIGLVE